MPSVSRWNNGQGRLPVSVLTNGISHPGEENTGIDCRARLRGLAASRDKAAITDDRSKAEIWGPRFAILISLVWLVSFATGFVWAAQILTLIVFSVSDNWPEIPFDWPDIDRDAGNAGSGRRSMFLQVDCCAGTHSTIGWFSSFCSLCRWCFIFTIEAAVYCNYS